MKKTFKPGAVEAPLPVVMVSCGEGSDANIITIAWTGIVNSNPPMTYISVRKERFSHHIIEKSGEFVINLVNQDLVGACDFCGVKSGAQVDKWKEMKLTKAAADEVDCPMIAEAPLSLECRVKEVHSYPTHDMFVAEVLCVTVDTKYMDDKKRFDLRAADLIAYSHGEYFTLGEKIGKFGISVAKRPQECYNNNNKKPRKGGKKHGKDQHNNSRIQHS